MKNEEAGALSERVKQSFQRLSSTAASLNSVSDKLSSSIANLEGAIKKLGLGITSWVPFSAWDSEDRLSFWVEEVGYAKVNGKWCIAIRTRSGHEGMENEKIDTWPFSDAPRDLRVRAVRQIPELIEELDKDAGDIAGQIVKQTEHVDFLAVVINEAVPAKPEVRKK